MDISGFRMRITAARRTLGILSPTHVFSFWDKRLVLPIVPPCFGSARILEKVGLNFAALNL